MTDSVDVCSVDSADVCIVGGGPAGMVMALRLGQLGCRTILLEATRRYERSFRGETLQPDTISFLDDLGVAESLKAQGWTETHGLEVREDGRVLLEMDFTRKPYRHRYMVDIPQNTLLDHIAAKIADFPDVTIRKGSRVLGLRRKPGGEVCGVSYARNGEAGEISARVVVVADGRYSRLRDAAGIQTDRKSVARDVIWCKLPRPADWTTVKTRILLRGSNHLILLPTYPDLVRTGINVPKGGFAAVKQAGLEATYRTIDRLDADFGQHFRSHVRDWSDFHFLEVFTAVARRWGCPGLLLVGDAAHTVTPLLGQGVNIAIEGAMVAADMLAGQLADGHAVDDAFVARYQTAREPQIRRLLKMQMLQERLLAAHGPAALALRRLYYTTLHQVMPVQRHLYDGMAYARQKRLGLYA